MKRPTSITIISWICIVFGTIALIAGVLPSGDITAAQRLVELKTHWYAHLSRMAMILSGVLMLYGSNEGRWLLVLWLVFHVVVGALHSPVRLLTHALLFLVGVFFLFRRKASAYFQRAEPV
jgi:hypothetical protein